MQEILNIVGKTKLNTKVIGPGNDHSDRVTRRKVRGLQMEEISCKCQCFFIFLLS